MIKEDYCSFEVAKLLKEKGFDETCYACYEYFSSSVTMYSGWPFEYKGEVVNNSKDRIKCPTLQMAMKWLREVHNIHIVIHPYTEMEGHNWSFIFDTFAYGCWQELGIYITDSWNTYEDAVEAACIYVLKNLII